MDDDADDADDPQWSLDHLTGSGYDVCAYPNAATTCRLLREFHEKWICSKVGVRSETLNAKNMPEWLMERFNVDANVMDWNNFKIVLNKEHSIIFNLSTFLIRHDLNEGEEQKNLKECARLIYNVHTLFVEMTRLLRNCNLNQDCRSMFQESEKGGLRDDAAFEYDCKNIFHNDEAKNTNFQNAFMHLARVLQGMQYRRANGKFFKRILTRSGFYTNAFEEASTIAEFISEHCAHDINFVLWQWATDPPKNIENLIKHMKDRALPEAPELEEDCHLRSYAGDNVGRGAGIYDCSTDMFFPYVVRDYWPQVADQAVRVRVRTDPHYKCTAPKESSVCVVHIDCVFPYDIWGELHRLAKQDLGSSWRNAEPFECTNKAFEIKCPKLADHLATQIPLPHTKEELLPPIIGRSWQIVPGNIVFPPEGEEWHEMPECALHDFLQQRPNQGVIVLTEEIDDSWLGRVTMNTYVKLGNGNDEIYYVPLKTPETRRRGYVSPEDMSSFGLTEGQFKKQCFTSGDFNGVKRFFRLHTGRTWLECDSEEIDQIYYCQNFTTHDRFMIYACKGRLFFEVGEFDTYEMTLFFEGIGGCGKTTVMKAEQAFWPSHLRGILSPNMQPQFGMSTVCKAKVVFCNEVSGDLSIVQEEWQTACSGEWGSYAVKFDDPVTMKWIAHMFWVGNGFPTKFKNLQGQVSRRLAGVLMAHPVTPRDGSIIKKIFAKLGALQRKQVLAYFEFIEINGSTDPMSVANELPPAFAEYYRKSRRATDPIEDFLSEGTFLKLDPGEKMLLDDFKELYTQYRIKYDLGKALRWSEASYRTPFNERGLFVRREVSVEIDGTEHHNVDVIIGLGLV
jgi:hypothetical protein